MGWERVEVWDSGLKIIKRPKILIPQMLLLVCNSIQKHVDNFEFSILCKGKWTPEGFKVSEDYIIPRQQVSSSFVQYDNKHVAECIKAGFNTVIHSHPMDMTNFSSIDEEFINSNFEASVLYTPKHGFCKAVINVQVASDIKVQVEAEPEIIFEDIEVKGLDNIQKYKPPEVKHNYRFKSPYL